MKVIICGAGKVGITIAKQLLLNTENDVTIIDYDAERINNAKNLDLKTIHGFSSSPEMLDRAGAQYADIIICVTLSDEINMLTAHIAGTMFNIKVKIARIRSTMYLSDKWSSHIYSNNVLGIDYIISPEIEVASHVLDMLHNVGLENRITFYRKKYELISVAIRNSFHGKTVKHVESAIDDSDLEECGIKFVKRGNGIHFDSNLILQQGDEIYVLCKSKDVNRVIRHLHENVSSLRNILVCGGGEIGFSIAKVLEEYFKVKLIESDRGRCEFLTENLSSTVIINGDMHDRDLITECGEVDAVVSVSNKDDANLFTTLIAKSLGVKECFTLIDERNYADVFSLLNLKNIINTRDITISRIISCISGKYFVSQKIICEGYFSICEFIVHKNAELNGMEFQKLEHLKVHILAVVRGGGISTNNYTDGKFINGDVVLVMLPFKNIHHLEELVQLD
jgi:trk system potassium uptake protein